MKMKFGAIVVDGRGKIGGHVASKNRGGAYLRTKVTPTNPQTSFQAAVRNRLTALSQGWRSLTQIQRNAWNNAVSNFSKTDIFGDIKQPSGLNLFVKLNSNLGQVGATVILLPPLPTEVKPVTFIEVTIGIGASNFDVDFLPDPVPTDTNFIVECTGQVSPGRNFIKNEFRFLQALSIGGTAPLDIFANYQTRFGALIVGQKIGVRLTPINIVTGQKGQPVVTTAIVAA